VRALAAALAALALVPATASAAADDLTVTRHEQLTPRLQEYGFTTAALSDETNVRILLPADYAAHPKRRYPVLYLLHGCCDVDVPGSRAWTTHGEAEKATEGLGLIVVMPDGGRGGFYSDWYNNGLGGTPMWETYHLDQLLPWVQANFRTRARREGRVIAGLSMGGFGAMKYAAEHPDWFVAAATFSGAVDTNQIASEVDALSALDGGVPGSVWGTRQTEEVRWRTNNPWDLAENLRGLNLTLRTGNGEPGPYDDPNSGTDPLESSVHDQTVALHDKLESLTIPSTFEDYGPGHHAWPYWARDLVKTLPTFMATLKHPPPAPKRVTYTSALPEYEVYGWQVKVDRPALEFSRLANAGRRGFTLEGSGDAVVTTPRRYDGAEVAVGDAAAKTIKGPRLAIPVPLTGGKTDVTITPCLTGDHVTFPVITRRRAHARVNGKRVRVRHHTVRVPLEPGKTSHLTVRARGFRVNRTFRACAS
jgi:S-formylglutathione hydrolase FrmB